MATSCAFMRATVCTMLYRLACRDDKSLALRRVDFADQGPSRPFSFPYFIDFRSRRMSRSYCMELPTLIKRH